MAASPCRDGTSSGTLPRGSGPFQQTFLECLIYVQHGNEQDRRGPCLHGATNLVGTKNSNLARCSKEVQGAMGQNECEGGVWGAPLPSAYKEVMFRLRHRTHQAKGGAF